MLVSQPPFPELALILCSSEDINESLKGLQSKDVEVEPPPSRMGDPKESRDSNRGPPRGDITRELQKIKLSYFVGGRASELVEAWLE
jgi:hypothetical protein